jgi:hypothetical protein
LTDLPRRSSDNTRGFQERDGNNEEQDDDEDDGNAAPLPSAALVVLGHLQLLGAAVDEGARLAHLLLDVVQLLSLRVHQRRHVHEDLVELQQVLLDVLHRIVPLLNLPDSLQHLPSPLLLNRLLQKRLTVPRLYNGVDRVLIRMLPCHRVVSAIPQTPNSE